MLHLHVLLHFIVHAECSCPCCMFRSMMHGNGQTRTYSMEIGTQHGHTVGMQHFDRDLQHGQGHSAWTGAYSMDFRSMMHGNGHGHASCTRACSMGIGMQHGHTVGMQHWQGLAAWTWTYSVNMGMDLDIQREHGHGYGHGHGQGQDMDIDYYWTSVDSRELYFS